MIRALALVAAVAGAGSAEAFECVHIPDVADAFLRAQASEFQFVPVYGQLSYGEVAPGVVKYDEGSFPPASTLYEARMVGVALGPDGFDVPFDAPFTLEVQCFLEHCGYMGEDIPVLTFLRAEDGVYSASVSICPVFTFHSPSPEELAIVVECQRGGTCEPDPDR
ncbi:hypothetical protein [Pseudaestuariivita sp.]|uniref:hypothetical protein n=1 Tax=Pseudaestuariivita sp. TaxID=2211669 RepID=UPI0040590A27